MKHIALVEDDERLAELVENFLLQHSFKVTVFNRGDLALEQIPQINPDILILDIMLPEVDGFTLCRELRKKIDKPILFLTAKDSDMDHVMGLEMGADDYMIKPVDPHVLLARVNTVLRRMDNKPAKVQEHWLKLGNLHINKQARQTSLAGEQIELTSHEFELLLLLAENVGAPMSRDAIHQQMIGREYDGLDRTVDVRISRLRKKLGDDSQNPFKIVTVWGKGYVLSPDAWE